MSFWSLALQLLTREDLNFVEWPEVAEKMEIRVYGREISVEVPEACPRTHFGNTGCWICGDSLAERDEVLVLFVLDHSQEYFKNLFYWLVSVDGYEETYSVLSFS